MSESTSRRSIDLGSIEPARSRHAGRRSAVTLTEELVVAGRPDGAVIAFERDSLREAWRWSGADAAPSTDEDVASDDPSVVAGTPFAGGVAVGTRGSRGAIRLHDAETGAVRWEYQAADDVGSPQRDTRFFLPFVADLEANVDRLYAAVRRYERDGQDRAFESAIYAFGPRGAIEWTYETDASPIALDVRDDRVAVAYNRCTGQYQHGLAVLDAVDGSERWHWDPGTDGQRRVGDVSLVRDGAVVASHGDYRGYRLSDGGAERWRVDLATPEEIDGETLYAYPNHVHTTDGGAAFVTGNTYAEEGRETESLHPNEHTAVGVDRTGERRWSASVGGFASGVTADGDRLAIPGAQHFRTRDPDAHGCLVATVDDGPVDGFDADGVVTAAALTDGSLAVVEEPVAYHDEQRVHGDYRLHLASV